MKDKKLNFFNSRTRIETVRQKLVKGVVITDNRGLTPDVNKIDSNVWDSLNEFLSLIPSNLSHYKSTKSEKRYFDLNTFLKNTDLNLKKLYQLFVEWFCVNKSPNLKLSLTKFSDYFNRFCNFGFRSPKVDLCDFCLRFEKTENKTTNYINEYENHIISVQEYRNLKNELINDSKTLSIEFYYNSNKVLPKIVNSERYYERAIYFYLANFHIHKKNISFMFNALKGESKKGANSVCTYLYYVINFLRSSIDLDSIEKFCFLSDAAVSQNRNWTLVKFCVFISILLDIKIFHIFPIRGHSYNICDTNFSTIGTEFKKGLF